MASRARPAISSVDSDLPIASSPTGRTHNAQRLMRHGVGAAFAAALLGMTGAAHADNIFQSVNTQLTASAGGQYTNYRETSQGQTLDTETGAQGAYQGTVSVQRDMAGVKDVYLSASFAYSKGRTDYNGASQNILTGTVTPLQGNTRTYSTDVTVKVGKAFPVTSQGQVIYYLYYGYHQWLRDIQGVGGYDEHYHHHSVGVGMIGQYAPTPKLVFTFEGALGGTFASSMNSDLISQKANLGSDLTETGSIGVDYAITRHVHVNAAYKITHFKYSQATLATFRLGNQLYSIGEPDSTTTNQTLMAGIGVSF